MNYASFNFFPLYMSRIPYTGIKIVKSISLDGKKLYLSIATIIFAVLQQALPQQEYFSITEQGLNVDTKVFFHSSASFFKVKKMVPRFFFHKKIN